MMAEQGKGFLHRGFMLDSVRHFMPVKDIETLLRAAEVCGMNRMHWHLTDDQGWRIEILRYPLLTEKASVRGRSFFGGVSETENNCGYYTQDEIRHIVRFSAEHGIQVIPEIELPGHASALLAAYPEYGCVRTRTDTGTHDREPWEYSVEVSGGIFPNLVCAGKEETVCFTKNILDEVIGLFPFPMVHIGGDEALKIQWRRCPDCRGKMTKLHLKDEDELQRELVLEVGEYLASRGRETIVWSDVLKGGMLPSHFIVQQWLDDEDLVAGFMEQGGRVICSDNKAYYFDYPYGLTDVKKIWAFPRIPDYAGNHEDLLLGIECPLWTERVTNLERAAFLLFPRMAAVGIKASGESSLSWESFLSEVDSRQTMIRDLGLNPAPSEYWDMTEEEALRDREKEHDRIFSKEALPYVTKEKKLVLLEKTERFMRQLDIPEEYALHAGDSVLADVYGRDCHPVDDADGAKTLVCQLMEAVQSRESGPWSRLPEEIWLSTMRCFPRFISEYRRSYGTNGFDRGFWTVRQVGCRLFRIGELEYELEEENGNNRISLHIPSDAVLLPEKLNDSLDRARRFLQQYCPDRSEDPVVCESWLLSPQLKELLPASSRILCFQKAFMIKDVFPEDLSALEWVFHVAAGQRDTMRLETLPEETALQRNMKKLLLSGKRPGSAMGVLCSRFG